MNDYINRQTAVAELRKNMNYMRAFGADRSIAVINEVPAADVQPVVRCKDCIHYMPHDWMFSEVWKSKNIADYPQNEIGCEWIDHYVKPDDYCSFAEQRDGEDYGPI